MKPLMVVVGGSSGIGLAICKQFKDKYQVINMSRRKNNEVENIYVDLEDVDSIINAFIELKEKYVEPEILIFSAGFVIPQHIFEIDYDTLIKTFNVNVLSAFLVTKKFIKCGENIKNKKIIYISSTSAERPSPGWSAYSSSKAALNSFSQTMSQELKGLAKVYCISCGRCDTPLRQKLNNTEDKSKIMKSSEVALVIEQLINDDGLLDGQNIVVRKTID